METSGEVEGRPRTPEPEQNLFLDTEKGTGGQRRCGDRCRGQGAALYSDGKL